MVSTPTPLFSSSPMPHLKIIIQTVIVDGNYRCFETRKCSVVTHFNQSRKPIPSYENLPESALPQFIHPPCVSLLVGIAGVILLWINLPYRHDVFINRSVCPTGRLSFQYNFSVAWLQSPVNCCRNCYQNRS
jgi:hypothetical protein